MPTHVSTDYSALVERDLVGNERYADNLRGAHVRHAATQWALNDLDAVEAAATPAVVTYPATVNTCHLVTGLWWSYNAGGTLSTGNLQVSDGGVVVFNIDITANGPGFIEFPEPKMGGIFNSLVLTLASGGAGVSGKVGFSGHQLITLFDLLAFNDPVNTQLFPLLF